MEKTDVEYLEYLWPMRHYLVTCGSFGSGANIIAVSFCMPVSKTPPLVACAVGHGSQSCGLIKLAGEFVVNVPTAGMKKDVYYCGFHSGRDADKFRETGLTALEARKVKTPIIAECFAWMECRVVKEVETGDKILFIGEVVESYASESVVSGILKPDPAWGEFPRKIYSGRFEK